MLEISEKTKKFVRDHLDDIKNDNFDKIISDAIDCDTLEILLEMFSNSGIIVPSNVLTEQLIRHYIQQNASLSQKDIEKKILSFNRALNMYQIQLIKLCVT